MANDWIRRNQAGRRNLTDDQRAMNAAELAELEIEKSKRGRAGAGGNAKAGNSCSVTPSVTKQRSFEAAAKLSGVSGKKVRKAQEVLRTDKALADKVTAGEIPLAAAVRELKTRYNPAELLTKPLPPAFLEMNSKTKGRPRNPTVQALRESPAHLEILFAGEAKTDRTVANAAYQQLGLRFLKETGMLQDFMGEHFGRGTAPRGWQAFMIEVGRWFEIYSDAEEVIRPLASDQDTLGQKAIRLKRHRLINKPATCETVERKCIALADSLLKQFPGLTLTVIVEGFRSAAAVLSMVQADTSV